jgi:hypothetical protein
MIDTHEITKQFIESGVTRDDLFAAAGAYCQTTHASVYSFHDSGGLMKTVIRTEVARRITVDGPYDDEQVAERLMVHYGFTELTIPERAVVRELVAHMVRVNTLLKELDYNGDAAGAAKTLRDVAVEYREPEQAYLMGDDRANTILDILRTVRE